MEELEGDEFPDPPVKHGGLDGERAEIPQWIPQEKVEEIDAEVGDEQPLHHRGELRKKTASLAAVLAVIISVGDAHLPLELPWHLRRRKAG